MSEKPTKPFAWEHQAYDNNYQDCGLTGYTGLDYHTVAQLSVMPAWRAQIGQRGFYKAGMAVMGDGSLIASPVDMLSPRQSPPFTSGLVNESWPVRLHRSTDEGRSWQPMQHTPLVGKEGSLTCLDDGVLLFTSESLDGVAWSDDGGATWEHVNFNTPRYDEYQAVFAVRAPIVHADGAISFVRSVGTMEGRAPEGYESPRSRAWLVRSTDSGRTWEDGTQIDTWDDSFPLFAEADFVRLPDGRILASSRFEYLHPLKGKRLPYPPGKMPNDHAAGHMVLVESADEGRSWSAPREFLQYSEVQGQLTLLQDGRLLCTYTNYHLPFGVGGVISDDGGRTWDFGHPLQLAISNGHAAGWATTRQLAHGTLVTIYALTPYHIEPAETGTSVCHSVRWEAPRALGEDL